MSSRREQKERLRRERIAREQAEAREATKRRRLQIGLGTVAALALAAVIAVVVLSSGGGGTSASDTGTPVPAAARQGLLTTPAPWQPQYADLSKRVDEMGLPQPSDVVFHHHAWLQVFVDGKPVEVPANIGIDTATQFLSPLHTHDTSGIVHIESEKPYPFTLGEFFTVWGVDFTTDQLGAYRAGKGKVLRVYVNGKQIKDPANYVMQEHDKIVVGYGKPGSFPTEIKQPFPSGL